MSFEQILQQAAAGSARLSARELKQFSNLERTDQAAFWPAWQALGPERRFEIAHQMVDLAEDNVELEFNEVWYWLLEDEQAGVRTSAIEGLWEDFTPRVLHRMLDMLHTDPDTHVRAAIAVALSRFAYHTALGEFDDYAAILRQALKNTILDQHEAPEVRRRALESAGYFSHDADIQQQVALAYESDEQLLRESALVAMGRSMLERWFPVIKRELESPSPALRYEAARAAGELADNAHSLTPQLASLVNDPDTEVALAAIWALGEIGGEAARNTLQRVSKSSDAARSQAAKDALDELSLMDGIL